MRKILAILLALTMVVGLGVSAWAATITISQSPDNGTAGNETYNAYRIFDVTKTSDVEEDVTTDDTVGDVTADGFAYTIAKDSPWINVVKAIAVVDGVAPTGDDATPYFILVSTAEGSDYNVVWNEDVYEANETNAKAVAAYLLENKPDSVTSTAIADAVEPDPDDYTGGEESEEYIAALEAYNAISAYTFTNDDCPVTVIDGYYLIDSTLGTNLILATANITLTTKNDYPDDDKTVAKTDWNVGDDVEYTITVDVPASVDYTKSITVHDKMDAVLSFNDDVAATLDGAEFTGFQVIKVAELKAAQTLEEGDEGYVAYDDCTFEIVIDISSLAPDEGETATAKTITFTYTAELLSTAAADTGYVNEEFTSYSDFTTTPKKPEVKTYDFDLEKEFTGAEEGDELTATFNLYGSEDKYEEDAAGTYYKLKDGTYTTEAPTPDDDSTEENESNEDLYESTTQKYKKTDAVKNEAPIEFVTDNTGYVVADSTKKAADGYSAEDAIIISVTSGEQVNVRGLASGTYYLTEISTAEGYNLLTEDIVITIDEDGNVTIPDGELFEIDDGIIKVTNNSGTVLPSTGGIGTTIFYIVGGLLAVGAGVVLITKKRMGKEDV